MTQEQDIVERLLDRAKFYDDSADCPVYFEHDKFLDIEAAQTIAALRAERDEWKHNSEIWSNCYTKERDRAEALRAELERHIANPADHRYWEGRWRDTQAELEAAEARVKELEAEISNLDAELDHWSQLAVDDIGKNPPTSWKEIAETAIRERDEMATETAAAIGRSSDACMKAMNDRDAMRVERDEARKELDRCRDRSVVVMIGDTGHYVSQAVADRLIALKEALEPFAEHADEYTDDTPDDCSDWPTFEVGDFRRARAASSNMEGGE